MEKYLVGVLILGLVAGLLLPSVGKVFSPLMKYLLAIIMFLSFLKIDTEKLIDQIVHPAKRAYLVIVSMIIVPIVLYVITQALGFSTEVAIAILLVSAMPAAMATPALSDILKGKTSLSIVVLLVGSLLTPFLVPRILQTFVGTQINYGISSMMIQLAWMIFIPWILAQEVKNYFPQWIHKTMHYYTGIEIFLLFFLVRGPIAQAAPYIYVNIGQLVGALLWFVLISIIMHLIGWNILPKASKQEKIASTLSIAYLNLPLAIVFANSFFSPLVAVLVILYDVPRNLMLIPFKLFLDKKKSKSDTHHHQTPSTTMKKSTKRKVPQKAKLASSNTKGKGAIPVKKSKKK